jgi:bifunctional DNA-binding transcriptional regulator/antitoxin component of YhaV-PrlF toxin-antitoxin module
VGKLSILELDRKGRLMIPKRIREFLDIEKKVLIINAGDHLKIIPLPSDPLKTLHGAFNTKKPFKELRKQAELTARKEIEQ